MARDLDAGADDPGALEAVEIEVTASVDLPPGGGGPASAWAGTLADGGGEGGGGYGSAREAAQAELTHG